MSKLASSRISLKVQRQDSFALTLTLVFFIFYFFPTVLPPPFICCPPARISGIPQLQMLREGLKLFISHFLLKSAAPQDAALTERARIATQAMEAKEAKVKL